jgi:hypothetical protein
MNASFETWAKESEPWLLDEPTDDADKRAKSAVRQAWTDSSAQMRELCAQVCRNAAKKYERRGQHSGIGWQVAVYLEREIRALNASVEESAGADCNVMQRALIDAADENARVSALLDDVRNVLNDVKSKCLSTCRPQPAPTVPAPSVQEPAGLIQDDSRFLAFWVIGWMPLMSALFLFVVPHIINWGEAPITGLWALAFVYAVFAPALYRLFIQGRRGSGRDG